MNKCRHKNSMPFTNAYMPAVKRSFTITTEIFNVIHCRCSLELMSHFLMYSALPANEIFAFLLPTLVPFVLQ